MTFVLPGEQEEEEKQQVAEDQVEDQSTEDEAAEDEQAAEEQADDQADDQAEPAEDEGLVVNLDEEPEDDKAASPVIRGLRAQNRRLQRELAETRRKINAAPQPQQPALGPRPTLEAYAFDTGKYEEALADWVKQKAAADAEVQSKVSAFQAKVAAYTKAKAELKVKDYADAELAVTSTLSIPQQSIIVSGTKNPALVVYALGKSDKRLRELAAMSDPVEFAIEVGKLEAQMKVSSKKPVTTPESRVVGNGQPSGTVNSVLERLRAEAAKTGDYTKVNAYKKKLKK